MDIHNKLTKQFNVTSLKEVIAKKKQFTKPNFNEEFLSYIHNLPSYQLHVKINGHGDTIPIDSEITLLVDVVKIEGNGFNKSSSSIKESKFKQEKESYWLILSSRTNNELVAIKRINRVYSPLSITFVSAEKVDVVEEFDVHLISDSVVGLGSIGSILTTTK